MPESEMVSKRKLGEANYFLGALREEYEIDWFYFKLSAFLNACYSVTSIMLYDYAERLGLGVTREDWLDHDRFGLLARSHRNEKALSFLDWWRKRTGELSKNPMWGVRGVVAHRDYPDLREETEVIYVPFIGSGEISDPRYVASVRASGHITVFGPAPAIAQDREVIKRNVFRFGDPPKDDVKELCLRLHDQLTELIEEAEKEFWL